MLGELGKISLNDTLCSLSHTGFSFFLLHFKIILEFHIVNQKESAVEVNRSDGELCRVCVSMSMALGGWAAGDMAYIKERLPWKTSMCIQPCHLLAVQPWGTYLTSLTLGLHLSSWGLEYLPYMVTVGLNYKMCM